LRRQPHAQSAQHYPLAEGESARLHRLFRLRLLTFDLLVLDRVKVYLAHAVDHVLVLEGDEPETTMALGLLIHQHHRLLHLAELIEVGLDLVAARVLTDTAHEDFLRAIGLFRAVLRRRVLRIDLLAIQGVDGTLEDFVDAAGLGERDEAETAATLQPNKPRTGTMHMDRLLRLLPLFFSFFSLSLSLSLSCETFVSRSRGPTLRRPDRSLRRDRESITVYVSCSLRSVRRIFWDAYFLVTMKNLSTHDVHPDASRDKIRKRKSNSIAATFVGRVRRALALASGSLECENQRLIRSSLSLSLSLLLSEIYPDL